MAQTLFHTPACCGCAIHGNGDPEHKLHIVFCDRHASSLTENAALSTKLAAAERSAKVTCPHCKGRGSNAIPSGWTDWSQCATCAGHGSVAPQQLLNALQTEQTMHSAWRKRGEEAEQQLAAAERARDDAKASADSWRRMHQDGAWHWVGDGSDFPESLVCPVLMSADQLRGLLKQRDEAQAAAATVCNEVNAIAQYTAVEGRNEDGEQVVGLAYGGSIWGPCMPTGYDAYELAEKVQAWLKERCGKILASTAGSDLLARHAKDLAAERALAEAVPLEEAVVIVRKYAFDKNKAEHELRQLAAQRKGTTDGKA